MIAVFINLDDSNPENGGLAVFPGSHKLGPQDDTSKHLITSLNHYS
jgi:phytanoyl-CoA hydroxylase